jgi:type II secretory pathway predicted ATPase ExeA
MGAVATPVCALETSCPTPETLSMLLEFYGLREQPFGVTPDPAYLYPSSTHRKALAALSSAVGADRGFMALIARPGMGKTTLLYQLLEELRETARTAFLFQTQCDSHEFFRYLLGELGVDSLGMDLFSMHEKLNQLLFSEMLAGRRFVLVVDEAQNLDGSVLETIRLLTNFETPHAKLLQIVLAGQPQLAEKLAQPNLAQLRQRIAVLSRLEPLSSVETAAYIGHRLRVAGHSGGTIFEPDASALIAECSEGIPRSINNLCFNALWLGFTRKSKALGVQIVSEAVASLDLASVHRRSRAYETREVPPPRPARLNLSYNPVGQIRFRRGARYASAAGSLLLLGGMLFQLASGKLVRASHGPVPGPAAHGAATSAGTGSPRSMNPQPLFGLAPPEAVSTGALTVVAGPHQSLREISLRYLGRFDRELFGQISALNPGLKDPDHVEPGRILLLPLRPGALRKVLDTGDAGASSKEGVTKAGRAQKPRPVGGDAGWPEFLAKRQDE